MGEMINAFGRTFGTVAGLYAGYRTIKWCENKFRKMAEEAALEEAAAKQASNEANHY